MLICVMDVQSVKQIGLKLIVSELHMFVQLN